MSTSLDHALALWRRGLSVIPVPRPEPGARVGAPGDGKVPAIAWREFQSRVPTELELREWFATDQNIAIVTGALSGVVVVDADSPESVRYVTRQLTYTPWQTQTPRGFHLFYRHPGGRVSNRARMDTCAGKLAIDIRGDGGYVIAAGSMHASGHEYLEAGDWREPRERVPVFWRGWLQRPRPQPIVHPTPGNKTASPIGDALLERARRYLAAIPRPEIGQGSDAATLYAACRLVRGFGLTEGDAIALLWQWAGNRDGWTRPWVAAKVQHALRYGTEPMGSLVS